MQLVISLGPAVQRREFITLLGGTAAWPVAVRAQPAKLPTIGFLGPLSLSAQTEWTAAFVQRMREHGWNEGRTIAIEYRWAEGRSERFAEIAVEFVRLKVDVIVTAATASVIAVKHATSVIPIVFAAAGDPVGTGLVASLGRPGGNVTGLSIQSTDTAGKRLEPLREVVPNLHRLAIMATGGPSACWRWVRFRRRLARLASKSSQRKSGERTISRRPSRRSRAVPMHSMS